MSEKNILMEDIIGNHSERMKNLSKYYPFFKLWDNTFSTYKDGMYHQLDMPYITLAVIRYFIEENQFNHNKITYEMVSRFITQILTEDFELENKEEPLRELTSYIFDKLCNEGRPFVFSWFDPSVKKNQTCRVRFIESKYENGQMYYFLTEEAIAFYLDTKEIKDESKISVEHVLLSKMVASRNFKGGLLVIYRINHEVQRLEAAKESIVKLLGHNVFEGVRALEEFMAHGLRWFDEEQKLFVKNKELVDKAMSMCTGTAGKEIYELDAALKTAMKKHSDLLSACTQLQMKADELVARAKHSRFRASVDFEDYMDKMTERDSLTALEAFVKPLFGIKLNKTLQFSQLDDLLDYKPEESTEKEKVFTGRERLYVYDDEAADLRIRGNFFYFLKVLFDQLLEKKKVSLTYLNHLYMMKFGSEIYFNGDYYSFLAHLSQKKNYNLKKTEKVQDTFLEGIMAEFIRKEEYRHYSVLNFKLEYRPDILIELPQGFNMTEIIFERTDE